MTVEWCTPCSREKPENKETPSCLSCSAWVSTQLSRTCRQDCVQMNVSLRTWTMCTWSPSQTGLVHSTRLCRNRCGPTPGWQSSWGQDARQAGQKPDVCEAMERIAEVSNPRHRCGAVPRSMQGIKVLGTPLGHPNCVATHLEEMRRKHDVLFEAIPTVPDVQSAWLLLLHCASARANYLLRVARPEWVEQFALSHDESEWSCLCTIFEDLSELGPRAHVYPRCLSRWVAWALRSARRTCSWADTLSMIQERHPTVADQNVYHLEGLPESPCLSSANRGAASLDGVRGWEVPQWSALARGLRPEVVEPDAYQPGCSRQGWQHELAGGQGC